MKKILFVLLLSVASFFVGAQSYSSGEYYSSKTYIRNICHGCDCQRAVWHSRYGSQWVSSWNGYRWVYFEKFGYYYWYTWRNYYNPRCY